MKQGYGRAQISSLKLLLRTLGILAAFLFIFIQYAQRADAHNPDFEIKERSASGGCGANPARVTFRVAVKPPSDFADDKPRMVTLGLDKAEDGFDVKNANTLGFEMPLKGKTTEGWLLYERKIKIKTPQTFEWGAVISFLDYHLTNIGLEGFSVTDQICSYKDRTPPEGVSDLAVSRPTPFSVTLSWTAPKDKGTAEKVTGYTLVYSTHHINELNFSRDPNHKKFKGKIKPLSPGTQQSAVVSGLAPNTFYHFAIKSYDQNHIISPLSNVVSLATKPLEKNSSFRLQRSSLPLSFLDRIIIGLQRMLPFLR